MRKRGQGGLISRLFCHDGENVSWLDRQRQICLVAYVPTVTVGIGVNLLGFSGPDTLPTTVTNGILLLVVLLVSAGFVWQKLSLSVTLASMVVIAQLFTAFEMLLCALFPSEYSLMLIVGNVSILTANVLFAVIAQLRRCCYVISGLGIVTYVCCVCLARDSALENFCVLFVLMFLFAGLLGDRLVRSNRQILKENKTLRQEERVILDLLRLEKEEVAAYAELAKNELRTEEADRFMDILSIENRRNLIRNVSDYQMRREAEKADVARLFPGLTPSEAEIAVLILQGRKMKEICLILGKSESNVSCQRVNIRKKLGLTPGENLYDSMKSRIPPNI